MVVAEAGGEFARSAKVSWPNNGGAGVVRCSTCLLRRQGWRAKYKRIEGLYREEGLSLRRGAGQRSDRVR
jgi:hypothetical protein